MDEDKITTLAREYAEEINPVNRLNDYPEAKMIADMMRNALTEVIDEQIKDFEGFLRFLLRRFCLVEKSKVKTKHKEALAALESNDNEDVKWGTYRLSLLESLFPDLTWDDDPIEVEIILKRKKK